MIMGAPMLGQGLSSIETGKLVNLVVINSNLLEATRNTVDIDMVMKERALFEAESMD